MIKKILSLAIIAVAACGISAFAQKDGNKMYQPQKFTDFAFEGILLDQTQQAKIDSLNAAFMGQCPKGDKAKCDKADKAKCDKAQCPKDKKMGNHRGQMRKQYAQQVKQILTPDQYVVFLENIAFMPDKPNGARFDKQKGDQQQCDKAIKHHKAHKGQKFNKDKAKKNAPDNK